MLANVVSARLTPLQGEAGLVFSEGKRTRKTWFPRGSANDRNAFLPHALQPPASPESIPVTMGQHQKDTWHWKPSRRYEDKGFFA